MGGRVREGGMQAANARITRERDERTQRQTVVVDFNRVEAGDRARVDDPRRPNDASFIRSTRSIPPAFATISRSDRLAASNDAACSTDRASIRSNGCMSVSVAGSPRREQFDRPAEGDSPRISRRLSAQLFDEVHLDRGNHAIRPSCTDRCSRSAAGRLWDPGDFAIEHDVVLRLLLWVPKRTRRPL
jgi:hypothetical protein